MVTFRDLFSYALSGGQSEQAEDGFLNMMAILMTLVPYLKINHPLLIVLKSSLL